MYRDTKLAEVAQEYADKCVYEHNPNRGTEYAAKLGDQGSKMVGENIAYSEYSLLRKEGLSQCQQNGISDAALRGWWTEYKDFAGPACTAYNTGCKVS